MWYIINEIYILVFNFFFFSHIVCRNRLQANKIKTRKHMYDKIIELSVLESNLIERCIFSSFYIQLSKI